MTPISLDWLPALDWSLLLIPFITGIIGYITNWVGIRLLFYPIDFVGVRVPGMKRLVPYLPNRIQQIPGFMSGRLGWQGIIPSRAEKMGSLAVDKGISKLGSQREFYEELDPERIAEHIVSESSEEIHALVEEIIRREHPQLWADAPPAVRRAVHARIDDQLPEVVGNIATNIGEHIDDLLDVKMMVVDQFEQEPELVNQVFMEVGDRELKFVINSGFYIGTLLGACSVPLFLYINQWWVLPVAGVAVGYITNYIAIKLIFLPYEPHDIGPFTLQGLFIQRQDEASWAYTKLVADRIITLSNIAENLLYGRQSDRTRQLIKDALRPSIDDALGVAGPAVRVATGPEEYESIRESVAEEGVEYAFEPLQDPELNEERNEALRQLMYERMRVLSPPDFAEMLRQAFKEDEWLLIFIGAVLGFVAGWIQLLVVNAV
ncbi:DUF445 domain-containing protein [Halorarius halobius]|uniref:DUF445 domain-containing protein n=1 Tax=Halorarius halobius TaxID=2962671 RepID=UPI0020CE8E8A|nr:hypothetical protein [Halorarius halobius]